MAYTLKERFANKNNIKNMSLYEVYQKYGYRDLLKDELESRLSINIDEVRDFYKNHNPNGYVGNYIGELQKLSDVLKLSPIELLSWNSFNSIPDEVANNFLNNDYSWLDNDVIVNKVSKNFLYESLLKVDIYKYPNLLEQLSFDQIEQILISNTVQYDKLPNVEDLIQRANLRENNLVIIINNSIMQKNYNLVNYIFNTNKLSSSTIEKVLLNIKNNLSFEEYLFFLESCPDTIIDIINANNGYYFPNLIVGYENKVEDIIKSSLFSKLNDSNIIKLFSMLDYNKEYELIINNNNIYERLKDSIDYVSFLDYFARNIDSLLPLIFQSEFLQNFLCEERQEVRFNSNWRNICSRIYDYILNDKEMLKTYFEKSFKIQDFSLIDFLYIDDKLTKVQQENLADFITKLDYNTEFLYKLFEKYPYLKERVENTKLLDDIIINKFNKIQENYTPNEYGDLMNLLQNYPEKINLLNIDRFLNICRPSIMILLFERYPIVANEFMHNKEFISKIIQNEDTILKFMPLLEKYNITNDNIKKMQKAFNEISKDRPELSWGNSSLNPTILNPEFINILGTRYINAILTYDSEASNIVKGIYEQGKLDKLKAWLDYLTINVSNNNRMIHFYIMAFSKMESLVDDILLNGYELNSYQKQLLEEIIEQDNIYNIKNIDELNSYFKIRAQDVLDKQENINSNDVQEIFFNTTALKKGVPWNQDFGFSFINMDYIKYKYVNTGIISMYEYEYLMKVKNIIDNNCDIGLIQDLINEYSDKITPTARMIMDKERKEILKELNSELIDLDEVRKIASYDDPNAEVYIEEKDGIQYIHLNGYDYNLVE